MTPKDLARIHERAAPSDGWSEKSFADLLRSPGICLCSAPHGFALARQAADEAELLMIAVDPAHQRSGHGARLLSELETDLKSRRATALFLEVRETNAAARALYHKAGFAEVARRKGYYPAPDDGREDALLLRKAL